MSRIWFVVCLMALISGNVLAQQPTWRLANGTAGNGVNGVDFFRGNPDTMYALCSRNLLRSTDRGENWDSISPARAHYGSLGIDPTNAQVIYISVDGIAVPPSNDVYRSTDGGRTFGYPLFIGFNYAVKVIEFDPVETGTVYIGVGPYRVYRTSNMGQTWDTLRRPPNGYYLNSLAIARSNNNIIYAGYFGGVAKSTDRGFSWTSLSLGIQPPDGVFVAIDPRDADVVYAGVWSTGASPGGMYKTTDGGSIWNEINNGIGSQDWRLQVLAINPDNPQEVMVGTDSDQHMMLRTTDGGAQWNYFVDGMAGDGVVNSIVFDTLNDRVYAGVYLSLGRSGLYIHDRLTSVSSQPKASRDFELFQNYPNPFNPTPTISSTTQETGNATMKVFDILGREVMSVMNQRFGPGEHRAVLDASSLPAGLYFYTLRIADFMATKHMILLR